MIFQQFIPFLIPIPIFIKRWFWEKDITEQNKAEQIKGLLEINRIKKSILDENLEEWERLEKQMSSTQKKQLERNEQRLLKLRFMFPSYSSCLDWRIREAKSIIGKGVLK